MNRCIDFLQDVMTTKTQISLRVLGSLINHILLHVKQSYWAQMFTALAGPHFAALNIFVSDTMADSRFT